MFLHGLEDRIQKEIYVLDLPRSLNGLVELALRVDARLSRIGRRACPNRPYNDTEGGHASGGNLASSASAHEPMQLGRGGDPKDSVSTVVERATLSTPAR